MWPRAPAEGEGQGQRETEGERARRLAHVSAQLLREVERGAPGARLSATLRAALERMRPAERAEVAARAGPAGAAPLFVAARRGNAEVAEYLVHVCGAPLEQRGPFPGGGGGEPGPHAVTPLWAAAVAGRLRVLRVLLDAGARVDARSDSGSTPLRSACFMTHLDAVRLLCERGADVHARNHSGGTCLINAVQCARLTRYLLARGADPDAQDAHGKTALHYAIREERADTARALLEGGASVRVRCASGDDALTAAAARGAPLLLRLVCSACAFPAARLADAHELLGATRLDVFDDAATALACWRHATRVRLAAGGYVEKRGEVAPARAVRGAREWRTPDELDALAGDPEALRAQATLVTVRVLGRAHRETLFRLMSRGAQYASAGQYARCAELWLCALQVRAAADTLLHDGTCHTLCSLTWLLVDLGVASGQLLGAGEKPEEGRGRRGARAPPLDVVMHVLRCLASALPEAQRLAGELPRCAAQEAAWERTLHCLVHLAALADVGAAEPAQRRDLLHLMETLVRLDPRVCGSGEALLHLACAGGAAVPPAAEPGPGPAPAPGRVRLFPRAGLARLLLAAGATPAPRCHAARTPLHAAVVAPPAVRADLLEVLVRGGAHPCTPDARGAAPLDTAPAAARAALWPHVTLACRAARALLGAACAPAEDALPRTLLPFLELHRCRGGPSSRAALPSPDGM